jgi:hypothetical protein
MTKRVEVRAGREAEIIGMALAKAQDLCRRLGADCIRPAPDHDSSHLPGYFVRKYVFGMGTHHLYQCLGLVPAICQDQKLGS